MSSKPAKRAAKIARRTHERETCRCGHAKSEHKATHGRGEDVFCAGEGCRCAVFLSLREAKNRAMDGKAVEDPVHEHEQKRLPPEEPLPTELTPSVLAHLRGRLHGMKLYNKSPMTQGWNSHVVVFDDNAYPVGEFKHGTIGQGLAYFYNAMPMLLKVAEEALRLKELPHVEGGVVPFVLTKEEWQAVVDRALAQLVEDAPQVRIDLPLGAIESSFCMAPSPAVTMSAQGGIKTETMIVCPCGAARPDNDRRYPGWDTDITPGNKPIHAHDCSPETMSPRGVGVRREFVSVPAGHTIRVGGPLNPESAVVSPYGKDTPKVDVYDNPLFLVRHGEDAPNVVKRSWQEDKDDENGNYEHTCTQCGQVFIGHKRRTGCKICVMLS